MTEKVNLTITIDKETHNKMNHLIAEGEKSKFVCKIIKKELNKIETEIMNQYQQASADLELNEQVKKWTLPHQRENGEKK